MRAACFIFITIYGFYRLVQRVSLTNLVLAGFALGLALVTKFSTLTVIPILLVLVGCVVISGRPVELRLVGVSCASVASRTGKLLLLLGALAAMGLLAYGMIWSAYRFRYESLLVPGQHDRTRMEQGSLGRGETRLLPRAYLDGLDKISRSLGRLSFLMGERSIEGWWYYFMVTFLLKTPLSLLILLEITPLLLRRLWRGNPFAVLFLLVPVVFYFGVASWAR
jgi:hypothetical protein